jgi:hypothetical protein
LLCQRHAGVEREFSKSGRVASITRARLNASTIIKSMRYKDWVHGKNVAMWRDDQENEDMLADDIIISDESDDNEGRC